MGGVTSQTESSGQDLSVVSEGHFASITDLANVSPVVLQGTVEAAPQVVVADESGKGNIRATLFRVRITHTYKDKNRDVGSVITVRQLGDFHATGNEDGGATMLEPGMNYTLFLRRFEFHPGKPTSEWVLVSSGMYKMTADKGVKSMPHADIPETVTTSQLRATEAE